MYYTFSPIANLMASLYQTETFMINLTQMIPLFLQPFVTICVNIFIQRYKVKHSLRLGLLLILLGSWAWAFIDFDVRFIILGNGISGLGSPFVQNLRGLIVATWFPQDSRLMASNLINIFGILSSILSILLSGAIFRSYTLTDVLEKREAGKVLTWELIYYEIVIITVIAFLVMIFFWNKPSCAPSNTATMKRWFRIINTSDSQCSNL